MIETGKESEIVPLTNLQNRGWEVIKTWRENDEVRIILRKGDEDREGRLTPSVYGVPLVCFD